jgi:hypothetical protein
MGLKVIPVASSDMIYGSVLTLQSGTFSNARFTEHNHIGQRRDLNDPAYLDDGVNGGQAVAIQTLSITKLHIRGITTHVDCDGTKKTARQRGVNLPQSLHAVATLVEMPFERICSVRVG